VYDTRIVLTLYKRHVAGCPHTKDRFYRRCRSCPVWIEGVHEGKYRRQSLKTNSWDRAEELKRAMERGEETTVTIGEANRSFLAELEARNVGRPSIKRYEALLENFANFAAQHHVQTLAAVTVQELRNFRSSWTWSPITSVKYLERLRSYFKFCMQNKWVSDNPALLLKAPKVQQKQVSPFEPEEVAKIIREAAKHPRHLPMVLLLRHSGLRIADAVCLRRNRVKAGKLFLYTAKTGEPVWLPLPEPVIAALESCPNKSPEFFFWTGEGKKQTVVNNWRDDLAKLFKRAGLEGAHPHRFRHTLAASLLEQGVPLSEVAMILGNSAKVVEKHYAGWNRARQKRLEILVESTWDTKLRRA